MDAAVAENKLAQPRMVAAKHPPRIITKICQWKGRTSSPCVAGWVVPVIDAAVRWDGVARTQPWIGPAERPKIVEIGLLQVGKDQPGPGGTLSPGPTAGRQALVLVLIHGQGQADLLKVVGTGYATGSLARR